MLTALVLICSTTATPEPWTTPSRRCPQNNFAMVKAGRRQSCQRLPRLEPAQSLKSFPSNGRQTESPVLIDGDTLMGLFAALGLIIVVAMVVWGVRRC